MIKTIFHFKLQSSTFLLNRYIRTKLYGDEIWLPHIKNNRGSKKRLTCVENAKNGTLFDLIKNRYIDLKTDLNNYKIPQNGTIRLEGTVAIRDAVAAGCNLKRIYFTNRNVLQFIPKATNEIEFYFIRPQSLKHLSSSKHPQSIIADAEPVENISRTSSVSEYWQPLPIFIVLDSVQDPRNIGMILRTATVFGISNVLFLNGCASPWNSNSVRAGMSAHFQIPFQTNVAWKSLFEMANDSKAPTEFHVADIAPPTTDQHINSAFDPQLETSEKHEDSDLYDDTAERSSSEEADSSKKSFLLPVSFVPHFAHEYFPLDWNPHRKVGIIFGNESQGISSSAYHLAHYSGGKRLFIPSSPSLSSLNVSMAVSSILTEAQRQFFTRQK